MHSRTKKKKSQERNNIIKKTVKSDNVRKWKKSKQ